MGQKTRHESRLNRPMEGRFGSIDYAHEELRASIAAMLVGSELKIGHSFGQHPAYTGNWSKILKDEPFQITKAAGDAQKIANRLLGLGKKVELNQTAAISTTLSKGEEIAYNDTTYKVLDKKGKSLEMEKTDTGEKFRVKPTDQLYKNLVEARNNPPAQQLAAEVEQEQEQTHKLGR